MQQTAPTPALSAHPLSASRRHPMQKAAIYVRDPLPAPGSITILTGKNQPEPRTVAVTSATARALTEIRPVRPKRYNWGVRTHRRGAGQPGPSRCHQRHSPGPDGDQTSKTQPVQLRCSDSPERRWPTGSEPLPVDFQRHSPGPDGDQTSKTQAVQLGCSDSPERRWPTGSEPLPVDFQRHSPGPDGDQTSKTQPVQLRCSDSPERRWPTGSEPLPPAPQPGP